MALPHFRIDSVLYQGDPVAVECVKFSCAAEATVEVVAAVTGKRIRCIYLAFQGDGTDVPGLTFKSNTTAITGAMGALKNQFAPLPMVPKWFETEAGEALNVTNIAGGGTAIGLLGYVLI